MKRVRWLMTLTIGFFCVLSANHSTAAVQPVTVCVQCHSALAPRLSNPVKLWQAGIHAEQGIDCTACHGGDPMDSAQSMSSARGFRGVPRATEIPVLCGGCHSVIATYYMRSDHGRALGRGGPSCVTCHGSHDIKKASPDLLGKKYCSQCHTFEKARLIRSAMLKRDSMLMAFEKKIKNMKDQGLETTQQENRLISLRSRFHAILHSFDIELIIKESEQIQVELEKTVGASGTGSGLSIGTVTVGCVLLVGLLLFLVRRMRLDE